MCGAIIDDDAYLERIGAAKISDNDGKYHPTAAGLLMFGERGIVIKKDPDKLVIENPGYIRTGIDQMLKGGVSDPRNKALIKMFNMIGIGERAGSGVPDIFAIWDEYGWDTPVIEEQYHPDRTILTLPFTKRAEKASRKNKQKKQAKAERPRQIKKK